MSFRSLTAVIHGESGVGKTRLADTAPGPRLFLDAEGGVKFTPSKKTLWDPAVDDPPEHDGSWDTCVVNVVDYQTMTQVYKRLQAGDHPFRTVVIDSLTEVQKRCIDVIAGTDPMRMQDWGELLRKMESLVRSYRDLTMHPTTPLEAVVVVTLTANKDGKFRPEVSGKLGTTLPGFMDVVGYMYTVTKSTGEDAPDEMVRKLLVQAHPEYVAKDRTGRLGQVIEDPNIQNMIARVFAEQHATDNEEQE